MRMIVEDLRADISIARISRAMNTARSTIYYGKKNKNGKRKTRIPGSVESTVIKLTAERTTYGYRRI